MSKASEYAARRAVAGEPPRFVWPASPEAYQPRIDAWVNQDGQFAITQVALTSPESALALAAWILETYGEKEITEGL